MQNNPLGIKAIDHLEFTSDSLTGATAELFKTFGFEKSQTSHDQKDHLYEQGQIRFLMRKAEFEQNHHSKYFKDHGEGVSKISFLVENAEQAISQAVKNGAQLKVDLKIEDSENGKIKTASIQGIGDILNEFVERPSSVFRTGYQKTTDTNHTPLNTRVSRIDHLTNNVPFGKIEETIDFYKRVFGFIETRYFDIKGSKTRLISKVVQLENNSVIIPVNEPDSDHSKSQIQEFLDRHKGPGVQHIALMTPNIIDTISQLQERKIKFLKTPHTYYQAIPDRNFKVTEDLEILEKHQILVDGDPEGYLLQIFSDTYIGPLFFEYIQRKNHWGFGNGNFQALFDAIERDQEERGYL